MDWPMAIAIAIPGSTLIVSVTAGVIAKSKRQNPGSGVSRRDLDGILNKKFEKVVYDPTCLARVGGIEKELKLTRSALEKGIDEIKRELRNAKK